MTVRENSQFMAAQASPRSGLLTCWPKPSKCIANPTWPGIPSQLFCAQATKPLLLHSQMRRWTGRNCYNSDWGGQLLKFVARPKPSDDQEVAEHARDNFLHQLCRKTLLG